MRKKYFLLIFICAIIAVMALVPVSAVKNATGPNYYYQVAPNISAGATVYLGEEHLNLIPTGIADGATLSYWESAADITRTAASKSVPITSASNYAVTSSDYGVASTSDWYNATCVADVGAGGNPTPCFVFRAVDPTMDVYIWAPGIATDVTGKSVTKGTTLQFGIVTNQYSALDATKRSPIYNVAGTGVANAIGDGYIDLKVKTESGAVLSNLYTATAANASVNAVRLTSINVTTQPYIWGQTGTLDADTLSGAAAGFPPWSWATDAEISGHPAYAPGVYTVWAESLLNNMKMKYTDTSGATYTGKTVSQVRTISIVTAPLTLPDFSSPPTDPDNDGIYEDLNSNTRLDFADVVLYFNQMEWIAANEPVNAFDLNGNDRVDFADIVQLFGEI